MESFKFSYKTAASFLYLGLRLEASDHSENTLKVIIFFHYREAPSTAPAGL